MENEIDNEVLAEDKLFIDDLLDNNLQVVDEEVPQRKDRVLQVLQRVVIVGPRRGGPTKRDMIRLKDLLPGDFNVRQTQSKAQS